MHYDNEGGSFPGGRGHVDLGVEVAGIGAEVPEWLEAGPRPRLTGPLRGSNALVQTCIRLNFDAPALLLGTGYGAYCCSAQWPCCSAATTTGLSYGQFVTRMVAVSLAAATSPPARKLMEPRYFAPLVVMPSLLEIAAPQASGTSR